MEDRGSEVCVRGTCGIDIVRPRYRVARAMSTESRRSERNADDDVVIYEAVMSMKQAVRIAIQGGDIKPDAVRSLRIMTVWRSCHGRASMLSGALPRVHVAAGVRWRRHVQVGPQQLDENGVRGSRV